MQRSIWERTWDSDLLPRKQMVVTYASVDGIRGSVTPRDRAVSSMTLRGTWISVSGALARRRRRTSLACSE